MGVKFEKGKSGNPRGRPPRPKVVTESLWYQLNRKPARKDEKPLYYRLAEALIREGVEGNVAAAKEVLDRIEGKIPQGIVGADGGPIQTEDVTAREVIRSRIAGIAKRIGTRPDNSDSE
jgi:hypothetical protein